jgi:hypothetical protein
VAVAVWPTMRYVSELTMRIAAVRGDTASSKSAGSTQFVVPTSVSVTFAASARFGSETFVPTSPTSARATSTSRSAARAASVSHMAPAYVWTIAAACAPLRRHKIASTWDEAVPPVAGATAYSRPVANACSKAASEIGKLVQGESHNRPVALIATPTAWCCRETT